MQTKGVILGAVIDLVQVMGKHPRAVNRKGMGALKTLKAKLCLQKNYVKSKETLKAT